MCRCRASLAVGGIVLAGPPAIDSPPALAGFVVALLMSLAFHECAHGWVALRMGDDTAQRMGRVTLNPVPHIDPIGTLVLPILFYVTNASIGLGWAKPTPVVPQRMRNPVLGMVLSAAAGPASNVVLAVLFAAIVGFVLRTGIDPQNAGFEMLLTFVGLNAALAVFNLLPVPPLDGSKVVAGALSPAARESYLRLDFAGLFIVLLLQGSGMLWRILGPPLEALHARVLTPVIEAARG
jgi:Zn-dependent protease